jgi:hypothetical protein
LTKGGTNTCIKLHDIEIEYEHDNDTIEILNCYYGKLNITDLVTEYHMEELLEAAWEDWYADGDEV